MKTKTLVIEKYPRERRHTLAILQDIQKEYGYIPREKMSEVADYLEVPVSEIYGIATFYKALSLKPKGKYIIKVCNGTACHIRNSEAILEEIESILDIRDGETTKDGLFSVEVVNCLGACALAPVMVVADKYYGGMTRGKVRELINDYRRQADEE